MTNLTLLAASIGFRMMRGYDFATALHEAAVEHDTECESWEKARQPKWDLDNLAQMEQPGQTMREWFQSEATWVSPQTGERYSLWQKDAVLQRLGEWLGVDDRKTTLCNIANMSIVDLMTPDEDGVTFLKPKNIPREMWDAIRSVEVRDGKIVKLTLMDKTAAIEELNRMETGK